MAEKKRAFKWKSSTPPGVEDLWYWQHEGGTSFNCHVLMLCGKADTENMLKLSLGWPELVLAWTAWHRAPNSDAFFAQYQEPV